MSESDFDFVLFFFFLLADLRQGSAKVAGMSIGLQIAFCSPSRPIDGVRLFYRLSDVRRPKYGVASLFSLLPLRRPRHGQQHKILFRAPHAGRPFAGLDDRETAPFPVRTVVMLYSLDP